MRTYDLSRYSHEDVHTKYAHKDPTTHRAPQIEECIVQANDWLMQQFAKTPEFIQTMPSIVDLGCDYGFQLHDLFNRYKVNKANSVGIDLYPTKIFPDVDIRKIDLLDCSPLDSETLLTHLGQEKKFDICIINHTLEHLLQPWHIIDVGIKLAKYIFIALPKHGETWATWPSHVTTWDLESLKLFMGYYSIYLLGNEERTLRKDENGAGLTEFWTFWKVCKFVPRLKNQD